MGLLSNLDLLTVGVAVAATMVLGFIVYFNSPKSITNKTFFGFTLATALWGVFNYLSYQFASPSITLWFLRLVLFFATWQALTMFLLCYVFPEDTQPLPRFIKFFIIPWAFLISILTLTPFVFVNITRSLDLSQVANPVVNKLGIALFGITSVSLVIFGIILLIKKFLSVSPSVKPRMEIIIAGLILSLGLIIAFNFLFPVLLNNVSLIPLGALFSLPFAIFTSYAILRRELFSVRAMWAGVLVFLLAAVTFSEVALARDLALIIYRSGVFLLILMFGIMLIRGILHEVRQREKLQELSIQLEAANEELKRLDAAKSEFISIAGHQLRAPLTVIKGYASMALEGSFGKVADALHEAIDRIFVASNQLVKLVSDLLDLSRIESGKIHYEFKQISLGTILKGAIKELEETAKKRGIAITFQDKGIGSTLINGDFDKLYEVAINLIDNAVKYSNSGSTVDVALAVSQKSSPSVVFSITDHGMGISKEDIPRLFTKFVRSEEAKKVRPEGMGLGLYLVKKIIEDHKGRVWVESAGVGKGSTFFVELPVH